MASSYIFNTYLVILALSKLFSAEPCCEYHERNDKNNSIHFKLFINQKFSHRPRCA